MAWLLAAAALGPAARAALVADGDGGMIVFHAPSMAGDEGLRMEPDYRDSLALDYQVRGDPAVRRMTRPVHGDGTSRTWRTASDHVLEGETAIRFRWVADGQPGDWSAFQTVIVTNTPAVRAATVDTGDGIVFTLDGTYEIGRFVSGDPYVVAPEGVVVTRVTPDLERTGARFRHGLTARLVYGRTPFHEGGRNAEALYDHATRLVPGETLVKVENGAPYSHSIVKHMRTLTVLAERPPRGTFRPSPYLRSPRELRHLVEMDLARVPALRSADDEPTAADVEQFLARHVRRPGFPAAGGSTPSRQLYPWGQMHPYHRGTIQDLALTCHLVMMASLDQATRQAAAVALVQRVLDIDASHQAARATDQSSAYFWEGPHIFAGVLLGDARLRGIARYGRQVRPGDYDTWSSGGRKIYTWDEFLAGQGEEAGYRNLEAAAEDMYAEGVRVWGGLLRERRIRYDGPAFEYPGIVDNRDGTWTIPANRFSNGALVTRGTTFLLDPRPAPRRPNSATDRDPGHFGNVWLGPGGGWTDRANSPAKIYSYYFQHTPQIANIGLFLHRLGVYAYHTLEEAHRELAFAYMTFPNEWYTATGHPDPWFGAARSASVPARADAHGLRVLTDGWLSRNYVALWNAGEPHLETRAPARFTRRMMEIVDLRNGREIDIRLLDLPDDGYAPIRDVEVARNEGPFESIGLVHIGRSLVLDGFAPGTETRLRFRAVNAIGAGEASAPRAVRVRGPSVEIVAVDTAEPLVRGGGLTLRLSPARAGDVRLLFVGRSRGDSTIEGLDGWTRAHDAFRGHIRLGVFHRAVEGDEEGGPLRMTGTPHGTWVAMVLTVRGDAGVAVSAAREGPAGIASGTTDGAVLNGVARGSLILNVWARMSAPARVEGVAEAPSLPAGEGIWMQGGVAATTGVSLTAVARPHPGGERTTRERALGGGRTHNFVLAIEPRPE